MYYVIGFLGAIFAWSVMSSVWSAGVFVTFIVFLYAATRPIPTNLRTKTEIDEYGFKLIKNVLMKPVVGAWVSVVLIYIIQKVIYGM